jgi:hypothetical protein
MIIANDERVHDEAIHRARESRTQATLFPVRLDDWIAEDNRVRVVEAFIDELDLRKLGFESAEPAATGRPATPADRRTHSGRSNHGWERRTF